MVPTLNKNSRKHLKQREPIDASASYGRYSMLLQYETSIDQQQEDCRLFAGREGRTIEPALEFADSAVSGTKRFRAGLDALLDAAVAGRFKHLYFYSLSRLARETVIGMPLLKRLVYVHKVRIVSVTEGVDSDREGWETVAQVLLMQHERYVKELSNNTLRGQAAIAKDESNRMSIGDYCFGYVGTPIPGSEQRHGGRHGKPRMTYAIDPTSAEWVKRIFHWFVHERRSLRWIARELNRLHAPKDHRATTKNWKHQLVSELLKRTKYIGVWPWGQKRNVRDPETGNIHQELRRSEDIKKWLRHFPELRLIDDETFFRAQEFLAENSTKHAHRHNDDGQFSSNQSGAAADSPQHLLSGLIECHHCGRRRHVGGARGKYMFCPGHHQGVCACATTLRRDRAERLILDQISRRILDDGDWVQAVYDFTLSSWRRTQATLPNELRDTEAALADAVSRTKRLIDQAEILKKPDPDLQQRLEERRNQRQKLEDKIDLLRRKASATPQEPTLEWVRSKLRNLHEVLHSATPAAAFALSELVGGKIVVEEIRREGRKRHYLRGTFQLAMGKLVGSLGIEAEVEASTAGTITIDFLPINPLDATAEEAKALRDQNLPHKEIALRMSCSPSQVTKLIQHWEKLHGQSLPPRPRRVDGQLCKFQSIANDVMRLVEQGLLFGEIGIELNCNPDVVTRAYQWWHQSRGLSAPDGRTRRKSLERKVSKPERRLPENTAETHTAA